MAKIKKYLDFDGLSTFWSKIKIAYSNADAIIEGKIVELDSAYKKADENLGKRIDDLTDTVGGNNLSLTNALNTLIGNDAAMNTAIEANTKAIEDEVTARTNAITGLQTTVNGKVDQSVYNTKISSLEGKDSNFETRIASLETTSGAQAAINAEAQARKDQDDVIEASVGLTADGG